jgi:hypothetical protein
VELEDTRLSQIDLENKPLVEVDETSVSELSEEHEENAWYEREAPTLSELRYESSDQLVSAFLNPPSHAPHGIAKLSELQRLSVKAKPVKNGLKLLQKILDEAQGTLVELVVSFPQGYSTRKPLLCTEPVSSY